MRGAGTDGLVVAMKPGNAGGAKGPDTPAEDVGQPRGEEPVSEAKPYDIPKQLVWEAYQRVKANRGAAGVDGISLAAFEQDLKSNLYKIWNRMSSGSYHPPPVRLVEIPKDNGRHAPPRHSDRGRSRGADGREDGSGAAGGTAVPPGLLRLSTRPVGARRSGDGAEAMLGDRLGHRSGHQGFL